MSESIAPSDILVINETPTQPVAVQRRAARAKYPKHAVTHEVVEAVLDVSSPLAARMHGWLDVLHALREQLRQDREADRAVGRKVRAEGGTHTYLTKNAQYKAISAMVAAGKITGVHSQVLQNVADRVDHGTRAWLSGKRGPLTFNPRKKYRSFTFTQYGSAVRIRGGRLHMSNLGDARLIGLRRLPGRVKSVTLVAKQGRWFAQFTCEVQVQHRARRDAAEILALPDTGLDTGLARSATLADGTVFLPAKPLQQALPHLRTAQRGMSRKFEARKRSFAAYKADFRQRALHGPLPERDPRPLSNRLTRNIKKVAKLHTKVECTRKDSLRKDVRKIEQCYRMVAVEEHSTEFMKRNRRTSRAVSDVAPGLFKSLLRQALGDLRYVPVGTTRPGIGGNSQTCLCGEAVPKTLAQRWHHCPRCGLSADRDTVSANIVMQVAFGYSNLGAEAPPEPGQGFVRCGEGECQAGQPVKAPQKIAAEPPLKRRSSSSRRLPCHTGDAQATPEVNNPQLLGGARASHLSG